MNTASYVSEYNDTFLWIQSNIPVNTSHSFLNTKTHSSEHNVAFLWNITFLRGQRHIPLTTTSHSSTYLRIQCHMFLHRNSIKLQSCRKVILIASAHTRFYEPNRTEPNWIEPNRIELSWTELVRSAEIFFWHVEIPVSVLYIMIRRNIFLKMRKKGKNKKKRNWPNESKRNNASATPSSSSIKKSSSLDFLQ